MKSVLLFLIFFCGITNYAQLYSEPSTAGGSSGAVGNSVFLGELSGDGSTTTNHVFIGHRAGKSVTTATSGVFIGASAGESSSSSESVFIGSSAGQGSVGKQNVHIGYESGYYSAGIGNVFIGWRSALVNQGSSNSFVGHQSGLFNKLGNSNSFFGYHAGFFNESGSANTFLGESAGSQCTTGNFNTVIGAAAGANIIDGNWNTIIGRGAGAGIKNGVGNTIIGRTTSLPAGLNSTIILSEGQNGRQRLYINSNGNAGIGLADHPTINNRLVIRKTNNDDITGDSGLSFVNLKSGYTIPSGTPAENRFLTVNAVGEVVLRNMAVATGTSGTDLIISGNQIALTNPLTPGNFVPLPAEVDGSVTNEIQTLSNTGDIIQLSQGGGFFGAGSNMTLGGTGTQDDPYVFHATGGGNTTSITVCENNENNENLTLSQDGVLCAKNIYTDDGALEENRIVTMNGNDLTFSSPNGNTGRVFIGNLNGTTGAPPNGFKLYVSEGILTERVRVTLRGTPFQWPDYVFAKEYALPTLTEVEKFIKANSHLPEVPSAKEIESEGIDLAEMQKIQMKKIEELTLYLIEQKKMMESQKAEILLLRNAIGELNEQNKN